MTLVNRVSLFFLVALAVGLGGYSLASYALIRNHLYDSFDHELRNALNVLVAAVEVEPDGVKWQPSDHTIDLGDEWNTDEVRWVLIDERGATIDQSRNFAASLAADPALQELTRKLDSAPDVAFEAHGWRIIQKQLSAPEPKEKDERDTDEFATVTVTVARNPQGLKADLRRLALLVSLLPATLWIVAAVAGRWYCQRALQPVRTMAAEARSIKQADFRARISSTNQGDELGDLAAAFNGLLGKLQQAFEQQTRFTGDAAHQLRTPLTILRGQIDVALRRPRGEAEYRETLDTLRQETESLQKIVESLLFLARAENDADVPREVITPSAWLPDYVTRWNESSRSSDLTYEVQTSSNVLASTFLLDHALDNLVGNAMKYSPTGTPIRIFVADGEPLRGTPMVRISVTDEGIGVAAEDRQSIFQPFYRAASARQSGVEGTGLGLALVARIAQALGGTVVCESAEGQGSRFVLSVPAAPRQQAAGLMPAAISPAILSQ